MAAIGAGILALAAVLVDWLPEDMSPLADVLFPSLLGLSTLLLAIALPGLQTRQAGRARRLGRVGFILTMIGVIPLTAFNALDAVRAAFPRAVFSVWWSSWTLAAPWVLALGGFVVTLVGIAVFGIATARANVLPRWAALMFALGLPVGIASGVLYERFFLPEAIDNPQFAVARVVGTIGLGIFALGLIRLGHALWAHGRLKKNLSKRLPEVSRPYSSRSRMPRTGFADKTVWDWLQLLIVPIVLAVASFWFTLQQDIRQQAIEEQRAQDAALEAHLDRIGELMLKQEAPLGESEEGDEVNTLARSRTLTVLSRLDGDQKARVVQFLYESRLIAEDHPVLDLRGANLSDVPLANADLSGANLNGVELRSADLKNVDLNEANLSDADLSDADLRSANLKNADFSDANLSDANLSDPNEEANLSGANLVDANLSDADLDGVPLTNADLSGADLHDATLEAADLQDADLRDAVLRGAWLDSTNLSGANLVDADLINADLTGTNVSNADLSGANLDGALLFDTSLRHADLSGAQGVTKGTLEADLEVGYVGSLEGATMPDGQLFEYKFEPTLAFSINADWQHWTNTTDELFLEGPQEGQLIFTSPSRVFDPSNPNEQTKVSAPENADGWVSWFQKHPNLHTSDPVTVTVGGASGMRIDVTASSTPENYPRVICGIKPCGVPLYPTSAAGISSSKGWKDRFFIVDVGGETVVIDVAAPADKFEAVLPKAQKILDTVEWKGG